MHQIRSTVKHQIGAFHDGLCVSQCDAIALSDSRFPEETIDEKNKMCSCIINSSFIPTKNRRREYGCLLPYIRNDCSHLIRTIAAHRPSLSLPAMWSPPRSHSLWLCSSKYLLKLWLCACFVFTFTGVPAVDRDGRSIMCGRVYMKMCNVIERRIDRVGVRARARTTETVRHVCAAIEKDITLYTAIPARYFRPHFRVKQISNNTHAPRCWFYMHSSHVQCATNQNAFSITFAAVYLNAIIFVPSVD